MSAETILLVEDEPELAPVIMCELRAEGYRIELVACGLAALDVHASATPNLVILDWMLPGLVGILAAFLGGWDVTLRDVL